MNSYWNTTLPLVGQNQYFRRRFIFLNPFPMIFCFVIIWMQLSYSCSFIFKSQPGKSLSSINSLHSLTTNHCFLFQSHSKTSHGCHVGAHYSKNCWVTYPRLCGGRELSWAQSPKHPSMSISKTPVHRENELKTKMEVQGRIQGFHIRSDEKAGGESEARHTVDEEWTKISTVSPLPL